MDNSNTVSATKWMWMGLWDDCVTAIRTTPQKIHYIETKMTKPLLFIALAK